MCNCAETPGLKRMIRPEKNMIRFSLLPHRTSLKFKHSHSLFELLHNVNQLNHCFHAKMFNSKIEQGKINLLHTDHPLSLHVNVLLQQIWLHYWCHPTRAVVPAIVPILSSTFPSGQLSVALSTFNTFLLGLFCQRKAFLHSRVDAVTDFLANLGPK